MNNIFAPNDRDTAFNYILSVTRDCEKIVSIMMAKAIDMTVA